MQPQVITKKKKRNRKLIDIGQNRKSGCKIRIWPKSNIKTYKHQYETKVPKNHKIFSLLLPITLQLLQLVKVVCLRLNYKWPLIRFLQKLNSDFFQLPPCLQFASKQCQHLLKLSSMHMVLNFLKLYSSLLKELS